MKPYPLVDDLLRPVRRVAMPRAPRLAAPGATVHGVARCANREVSLPPPRTSRRCPPAPGRGGQELEPYPSRIRGFEGKWCPVPAFGLPIPPIAGHHLSPQFRVVARPIPGGLYHE